MRVANEVNSHSHCGAESDEGINDSTLCNTA